MKFKSLRAITIITPKTTYSLGLLLKKIACYNNMQKEYVLIVREIHFQKS